MPRLIYSLLFELAPGPEADQPVELIVPLAPDGQSKYVEAEPPKGTVIDLRVGDWCRHGSLGRRKIRDIRAYRDTYFPASRRPHLHDGYFVQRAPDSRPETSPE
jgi:hypothetical protein